LLKTALETLEITPKENCELCRGPSRVTIRRW